MNATIQEIEGIDDYWGPAFRSVYEGEGHEAFVQQLDERIIQHDKEIEKLCNFHYQKKRKRGRRPNRLRGVCEDAKSSMSQYEDNNNHIPKRRRIDPKRLGGYINTFPEPGTQCEPSDPHNFGKVSLENLSDENLEETLDMGISSDEYEEITEYHTLQQLKQENHQLMSKKPDSSTDDLRLYLRNRNRLTTTIDRQNLLISVEEASSKPEQQSDYSCKTTCDQQQVDQEVYGNSSKDLRSYLRSKLSDEQLGQEKQLYSEYYGRQSQPEVIPYDERNNHHVEHRQQQDKDQELSLSSKCNIGPRQYDGIRYDKRQSRRPSIEHNKDQIQSLSTEYFKTQNRHEPIEYIRDQSRTVSSLPKQYEKFQSRRASAERDKVQGSNFSERNRRLSRHENFEYDKSHHRRIASESRSASAEHDKVQGSVSSERNRRLSRHENFECDKSHHRYIASESRSASAEHEQIQGSISPERNRILSRHENFEYDKNHHRHIATESRSASAEHDKVQGSMSSERNSRLSRHENFEYDKNHHRHIAFEEDRNENRREAESQRVKNHSIFAVDDRGKRRSEFVKRHETIRPSQLSSEHNTRQNLHENIGRSHSPHSFKGHIRSKTLGISDRDGTQGLCIFVDQHIVLSQHSAEYDKDVCESTERPKVRSRHSLTEGNIIQSRPSSCENYKQSLHPVVEHQRGQSQEQTRGGRRFSTDYDRKSVSSYESADFDRGRRTERRRIYKSRPLLSEQYQREIQGASKEYQRRERNHPLFDEKSQFRSCSAEQYVQSGQFTEYTTGRNRFDSLEGHKSRRGSGSVDSKIRHNGLSYSEFESQFRHKVSEVQKSRKGPKNNECFNSKRDSLLSANITASYSRSYRSADLQQKKIPGYPKLSQVDDQPLTSNIGRQDSSETCLEHHPLLHEIQRETYRKSPDCEALSQPLPSQNQLIPGELCKNTVIHQHTSPPGKLAKPNYEESLTTSSAVHISNRVTSSQFFQNEILELELSHAERNDIENLKLFERQPTEAKSSFDGVIKNCETVLLSDLDTDVTMEISTPRYTTTLSTINPEEQNATNDFSNIDLSCKLTNRLEALLPRRGSSEPRDHSAEMSSIQDINEKNYDSIETVIVDEKTDDACQKMVSAPDVKCEPNEPSYDEVRFNASNDSSKDRHLDQDEIAPEFKLLPESNLKSEPIDHDSNRKISSAVGFIKSEIKQEPDVAVMNTAESTSEADLVEDSSCIPYNNDKQSQATVESSPASPNDRSFRVSVRDVNSINLLLSGPKIESLNAVINKTDICDDDHGKMDVSVVTTNSWYTPRKITFENCTDKTKKPSISDSVNSCDPRLRPNLKNSTNEILNEKKTEVFGKKDIARSEINIESDNTVATKSNFLTFIDGQNGILKAEEKNVTSHLSSKCGKLMLDILKTSKDNCCPSNKTKISPESPQIQYKQFFNSLKPIDIETQVGSAIPIYAHKNHNINDWIDRVNKVAAIHNWSDQQVVGYAIPKIMGKDFDSNISWAEWQEELRKAFPPKVNYGKMLLNMLNTKAKIGDSLVKYYYEKKTLLDKCNITGENAIECIIFGIEDESVRTILDSLNFDDQEQLLTFLSNFKN